MSNKRLFFNSLKVIIFVKLSTNTFLKPINCSILSSKMCSNTSQTKVSKILFPPEEVRGMLDFNEDAFTKTINFPGLYVEVDRVRVVQKLLYGQFVRLLNFRPVIDYPKHVFKTPGDCRCLLLNPDLVTDFDSIDKPVQDELINLGMSRKNFVWVTRTITFNNWKQEDLINSVLPEGLRFSGYTIVGHIAHFNLRSDLLNYKYILGMIVLHKIKNVKTVVNKLDIIDNTYRNFRMEVICGKNKLVTTLKENSCTFELDFSTVYWNSRLATEHERIVEKLSSRDVLYDVFAGIGPFSVPAAKKGCYVLANDLNPESVKWLKENVITNKIDKNFFVSNKDAKDFILTDVKKNMLEIIDHFEDSLLSVHIVMNLPSTAVTYLQYFKGLFTPVEYKKIPKDITAYVYCFVKDESRDRKVLKMRAKELFLSKAGQHYEKYIKEIFDVRHVSTNKDMFRISVELGPEILVQRILKRTAEEMNLHYFVTEKHNQFFD